MLKLMSKNEKKKSGQMTSNGPEGTLKSKLVRKTPQSTTMAAESLKTEMTVKKTKAKMAASSKMAVENQEYKMIEEDKCLLCSRSAVALTFGKVMEWLNIKCKHLASQLKITREQERELKIQAVEVMHLRREAESARDRGAVIKRQTAAIQALKHTSKQATQKAQSQEVENVLDLCRKCWEPSNNMHTTVARRSSLQLNTLINQLKEKRNGLNMVIDFTQAKLDKLAVNKHIRCSRLPQPTSPKRLQPSRQLATVPESFPSTSQPPLRLSYLSSPTIYSTARDRRRTRTILRPSIFKPFQPASTIPIVHISISDTQLQSNGSRTPRGTSPLPLRMLMDSPIPLRGTDTQPIFGPFEESQPAGPYPLRVINDSPTSSSEGTPRLDSDHNPLFLLRELGPGSTTNRSASSTENTDSETDSQLSSSEVDTSD